MRIYHAFHSARRTNCNPLKGIDEYNYCKAKVSDALVLGVNFKAASEKVWDMPLESVSVNVNGCGWVLELLTFPKLAESGSNEIVALAALVRFSRPAP